MPRKKKQKEPAQPELLEPEVDQIEDPGPLVVSHSMQMAAPPPDDAPTIDKLLHAAVDKNVSPEALEKLLNLEERITARQAKQQYAEALEKFQSECPPIFKATKGQLANYAKLDDIEKHVRPYLRANGFSYDWDRELLEGHAGWMRVVAILRHQGGHEERRGFPVPIDQLKTRDGRNVRSGAQEVGASDTYGMRRSFLSVLGMAPTDDNDADQPPAPADLVSQEQAANIRALAGEVGADLGAFLKWIGADSIEEMRAVDYEKAVRGLEQKRNQS